MRYGNNGETRYLCLLSALFHEVPAQVASRNGCRCICQIDTTRPNNKVMVRKGENIQMMQIHQQIISQFTHNISKQSSVRTSDERFLEVAELEHRVQQLLHLHIQVLVMGR